MIERLRQSGGYSLVEVMASIVILSIAIIPMVGMFDLGLKTATASSKYDEARALANEKLEQAKSLPYEASASTTDLKDNFPRTAPNTQATDGSTSAAISNTTEAGVPDGLSYTVRKRHMKMASTSTTTSNLTATGATSADGLIEVTVTVSWGDGKSYTTSGIVSRGTIS
jgi:prepilin-type N-terminal cleavage/methylation domain-containing protein